MKLKKLSGNFSFHCWCFSLLLYTLKLLYRAFQNLSWNWKKTGNKYLEKVPNWVINKLKTLYLYTHTHVYTCVLYAHKYMHLCIYNTRIIYIKCVYIYIKYIYTLSVHVCLCVCTYTLVEVGSSILKFKGNRFPGHSGFPVAIFFPGQTLLNLFWWHSLAMR